MPIIRTSASDRTAFLRVNAESLTPVAPNLRRPATYAYVPRVVIPPINRASLAAKGASPANSVLGVQSAPIPPSGYAGTLAFTSSATPSFLKVAKKTSLFPGTGDFTVSFYLYFDPTLSPNPLDQTNKFPRVFALSQDTGTKQRFAVSIEGNASSRTFYLWYNGGAALSFSYTTYINSWHFVNIVGEAGKFYVEIDGVEKANATSSYNIANTADATLALNIGAYPQDPSPSGTSLSGYLANFRWVVGEAIHYNTGSKPFPPLPVIPAKTSLFLLSETEPTAYDDSGTDSGNTVITLQGPTPPVWSSQIVV